MSQMNFLGFQSFRKARIRDLVRKDSHSLKIVDRFAEIDSAEMEIADNQIVADLISNVEYETTGNKFSSGDKPSRYFVNSTKCKMPYADPFSREALEIYHPAKLKVCTNESDTFYLNYDQHTKHYKLYVNEKILSKLKPHVSQFKCNYRAVTRGTNEDPDRHSDIHSPIYFRGKCTLPQNLSGIIVECHDAHNISAIVQQDAFSLVQVYNKESRIESDPLHRQPSVIILGLDSMSRMNFQRTMPKTLNFVRKSGWFEMEGYNKVADNTVPNLLPILTGHMASQLENICEIHSYGCLDKLPWIWTDYARAGYTTALGEDILGEGIFVMDLPGFKHKPVNYYLRPLLLGISRVLRTYKRFGYDYCIGRRLSLAYVYDFCAQFTARFVEELDQPTFALFWSCTFTHDYYFGASSLDAKFVEYLRLMERHRLFERSIVILMSDHGARFGDLSELSDSFLEERLPMLHVYLPPWFRDTYPKYAEALQLNRNRLSSNYDLHNTLRHILRLNASTPEQLPLMATCPGSQSLLHPLPVERSCQDACIGEHWCTCNEFINQALDGDIYLLGKQIVYHINRWMVLNGFNKFCQRILLQDMENAEKKVLFEENGKETIYGNIGTYRLRFRTHPAGGKFQTTLRFNRDLKTIENLFVPDISRLNSYKNSSQCVNNKIAKKFCFCYPKGTLNAFMVDWKNMKLTTLHSF
ncbi:GH25085 [Drosophila grimshawi]|uniref:GH25085 n=1 Tax=Drosophila grimshawi TaxID=7222 RepID=B4JZE0_DROGR|nr:GH25085 [Drosophila grimshawi]